MYSALYCNGLFKIGDGSNDLSWYQTEGRRKQSKNRTKNELSELQIEKHICWLPIEWSEKKYIFLSLSPFLFLDFTSLKLASISSLSYFLAP
jgi:hypothetical protein